MAQAISSQLSLAEAHRLGWRLYQALPGRGAYGDRELNKLAEESGLSRHQARAFRNFAEPKSGYTREELQGLLNLCRPHGCILPVSVIDLLVRVPRGQRRGPKNAAPPAADRSVEEQFKPLRRRQP
jgi:hypothetical protein